MVFLDQLTNITQLAHDVRTTILKSWQRPYNVVLTSCAGWIYRNSNGKILCFWICQEAQIKSALVSPGAFMRHGCSWLVLWLFFQNHSRKTRTSPVGTRCQNDIVWTSILHTTSFWRRVLAGSLVYKYFCRREKQQLSVKKQYKNNAITLSIGHTCLASEKTDSQQNTLEILLPRSMESEKRV